MKAGKALKLQRQNCLAAVKAAAPFTGELKYVTAEGSPIISDFFKKLLHYFLQGGVWGSAMTLTR